MISDMKLVLAQAVATSLRQCLDNFSPEETDAFNAQLAAENEKANENGLVVIVDVARTMKAKKTPGQVAFLAFIDAENGKHVQNAAKWWQENTDSWRESWEVAARAAREA